MPVDGLRNSGEVVYNPDPILQQERPGRSWDCENDVVWGCESHFGARVNGDRGCLIEPDSVIDGGIATSRAKTSVSVYERWQTLSWFLEEVRLLFGDLERPNETTRGPAQL